MKKILSFLFIGLLAFILIGCKKDSYSISIDDADKNITLFTGDKKEVKVSFEGDGVVWSVDNDSIVSVKDGLITALSEGSAIITVSVKDHSDINVTINVTVNRKQDVVEVTDIAIVGKKTEVKVGDSFNLTTIITPTNATNKDVTWASSDPTVASVAGGKVTALKAGTTEISATAGSKTDKFTLTVKEDTGEVILATDLFLEEGKLVFNIGETDQAYAEVDEEATDKVIVWSTSDDTVITIDENGLITAVGPGKADVIAETHDGSNLRESYKVMVYNDVTEMTITGESEMPLNGTQKLKLTVNSDSSSRYIWSSSDESIATVDTTGLVSAIGEGTVKIKCKADDSHGLEKEFEITVKEVVVTEIIISGEHGMSPNTTQTLTAKGNVDSNPRFVWASSDEETATISEDGLVTALKEGTVTITCEVQDSGKLKVEFEIIIIKKEIKIGETSYDTIALAMEAAQDGDVIEIGAGTYDEAIVITKSNLTFKGNNSGVAGYAARKAETILAAAVQVKASNITFDGIKFTGAAAITLGEKGATDLVVDNILFTCDFIESTPISAEGCNRYGSLVNASATSNVTIVKTYMNCGTNTGQRSNIAMAQKMTNLTIHDSVLHQDATSGGICEAIMTYNIAGRWEITNCTIENTTTNWLVQLGYNANACTYILFKDNICSAKDKTIDTSGFNFPKIPAGCTFDFIHNYIYKATGSTFSFGDSKDGATINLKYNYFNGGTPYKCTNYGYGTFNFENNYYEATQTTATTDAGVVKSLEELEALYKAWNDVNGYYLPAGASAAASVTVGAEGCDYTTLDAAIAAASDGSTITLKAGDYTLTKAITKKVNIVGESKENSKIKVTQDVAGMVGSGYIKFTNLTVYGDSATAAGNYFQDSTNSGFFGFENCIIKNFKTFIKFQKASKTTILIKDSDIEGIGQFLVWTTADSKIENIYFINNKLDAGKCGQTDNNAGTLLRARAGNCYVYGNYIIGTPQYNAGLFENGTADKEYFVKYNTFENATKFVYNNGSHPVIFDYNLYLDASKNVLSEVPSAVAPSGYGVTSDANIMGSEEARANAYAEFNFQLDLSAFDPNANALTFDLAGGTCENLPTTFETGEGLDLPVPTREQYKFVGWLNGEDLLVKLPYNAKGAFTLVAKWKLDAPTHDITFVLDGGTLEDKPEWYMEGMGLDVLPVPSKFGYNFIGWFEGDDAVTSISADRKDNVTLTAHWEEKPKHDIVYNLDGGANPAGTPTTYYEGIGIEELPTPAKENYVFQGWFASAEFTGDPITKIDTTDDADFALYAKWIALSDTFSIHFNLNNGSILYASREELVQAFIDDYALVLNKGKMTYRDVSTGSFSDCDYHTAFTKTLPDGTTFYAKWKWLAEYLLEVSEKAGLADNNCNVLGLKDVIDDGQVSASGDNLYGLSYSFRAFLLGTTIRPGSSYTSADFSNEEYANGFWEKLSAYENPTWTKLYGEVTLPQAHYMTYDFAGWFESSDFSGDAVTTLSGRTGTVELYAKFGESNPVTDVSFNEVVTELKRYETKQLAWTILPANADVKSVIFKSSNPNVISVDDKGLLTALAVGTATITITSKSSSGKSATMEITVYSPDHFDVSYESTSYVEPTKTIKLNAEYIKRDGTKPTITWSSLDTNIATVENGVVTGVASGYTTIRASVSDSIYFDFTVTVVNNASDVLSFIMDSHNSTLFTHYDLGIGAGKPAYYRDIIGSVSDLLYNDPLTIKTDYESIQASNSNNHGGVKTSTEFITVHYTGNMSATSWASANASYFAGNTSTSIHYVTGSDGVYHVLDDKYVAYHAGDGTSVTFRWTPTGVSYSESDPKWPVWGISANSKFTINGKETSIAVPTGSTSATTKVTDARWINDMGLAFKVVDGQYYMGTTWWCYSQIAEGRICNKGGNNNSIGIESAVNPEGDLWFTWQKTAQLVAKLMLDNNLDITRVVGHHFYTAKDCPQPLLENDLEIWWKFIEMVEAEYAALTTYKDYTFTFEVISDANNAVLAEEHDGSKVFFSTANGRVAQQESASSITYKVTITKASDPGYSEEIVLGSVLNGIYSK